MNPNSNTLLIQVIKGAIARAEERIARAQAEIFRLECELAELGVELPLPLPPASQVDQERAA